MLIDKPLSELRQYEGRNPRPDDFDAFWERALGEQRATDPAPEFIPADFCSPFADYFHLYFTGVRGARVHAKFIKPKNARPHCPAVFCFHGYGANSGDWSALHSLAAAGLAVAALDCRGQGGDSEDTGGVKGHTHRGHIVRGLNDDPDNLLFRHIFLDTAQLVRVVSGLPCVDSSKMGAYGGSQGGGLSLACGALSPEIKLVCARYPFLCDYKRVWEMDLAKDAYAELRDFFRLFDPRHERSEEYFTRLGYIDVQFLAPRIKGDVLMSTGMMDTVCPPSTQFAAFNKITSNKEVLLYPDFGHEDIPGQGDITFRYMCKLLG